MYNKDLTKSDGIIRTLFRRIYSERSLSLISIPKKSVPKVAELFGKKNFWLFSAVKRYFLIRIVPNKYSSKPSKKL